MDIGVSTGSSYCVGSQASRCVPGASPTSTRSGQPGPCGLSTGTLTTGGPPGRDRLAPPNPGFSFTGFPENKAANPPGASLGARLEASAEPSSASGGHTEVPHRPQMEQACELRAMAAGGTRSQGPEGPGSCARGGAGRPVAGGCPASCGAHRVSYHGACAWHSGREGTGDGRGQAGLVLCLAWGPSPKTRSPQPRVTGPGPGTCAVQALSAPARQGHALPRLSRPLHAHPALQLRSTSEQGLCLLFRGSPGGTRAACGLSEHPHSRPRRQGHPRALTSNLHGREGARPCRVPWAEWEGPGQESCTNAGPARPRQRPHCWR